MSAGSATFPYKPNYGPRGRAHVRVALTATDERIEAAAQRLAE